MFLDLRFLHSYTFDSVLFCLCECNYMRSLHFLDGVDGNREMGRLINIDKIK